MMRGQFGLWARNREVANRRLDWINPKKMNLSNSSSKSGTIQANSTTNL